MKFNNLEYLSFEAINYVIGIIGGYIIILIDKLVIFNNYLLWIIYSDSNKLDYNVLLWMFILLIALLN